MSTTLTNARVVLLVGRDAKYNLYLRDALRSVDMQVVQHADVAAAREYRAAHPELRLLIFDVATCRDFGEAAIQEFKEHDGANQIITVIPEHDPELCARLLRLGVFDYAVKSYKDQRVVAAVLNAYKLVDYATRFQELNEIGVALSKEHDLGALLELILHRCRDITSADAGSLYLKVDPNKQDEMVAGLPVVEGAEELHRRMQPYLVFKVAQNDSVHLPYKEFPLPITKTSIAGYVAATGNQVNLEDCYHLAPGLEFTFDKSWDQHAGYKTKSMLVVPMRNHLNEVIGVIQLINRKIRKEDRLAPLDTDRKVIPFDKEFEEMALSLASQSGVSVENTLLLRNVTQLLEDIERLFKGFVEASAKAIEARDNTTAGHSDRIKYYALAVARRMTELVEGPFQDVSFTEVQLKELEYASILHDIGKIGVPEKVLVKATRLDDGAINVIRYRFAYYKEYLKQEALRKQMRFLLELSSEAADRNDSDKSFIHAIDEELKGKLAAIDEDLDFIVTINKLGFLSDENEQRLRAIAAKRLVDTDGQEKSYLTDVERENLSVKRGNLTDEERAQINKHVEETFKILRQIPWNKDLAMVPMIAGCHHERNDGSGYPGGLTKSNLPIQARILAVVDVYEALTAQDRPYKKAKPIEVALKILQEEANHNRLDPEIVDLFIRDKLYEVVDLKDIGASGGEPPRGELARRSA